MDSTSQKVVEEYHLLFGILGTYLYLYPTASAITSLAQSGMFEEEIDCCRTEAFYQGAALAADWCRSYLAHPSGDAIAELRIDATRLFAGQQHMAAPPWESVYFNRERMLFQEQTLEVRGWYKRYGMELTQKNHEPDDHIGYELDFISRLLKRALECEDERDALSLYSDARSFAQSHPLKWASQWSHHVQNEAHTSLYRGMAIMVPELIDSFVAEASLFA